MSRNNKLALAIAAIVVAALLGWVAGRQVRSPAEIAAETAAPKASLITAPVESRRLTADVVTRGTVGYGSPIEVSLPVSTLKSGNDIVTIAPQQGAVLNEGNVALAVSARPVIVLQGGKPMYRDLARGTVGEDVSQLEASLARLGFDPGAQDGVYDANTRNAVSTLYRAAGWEALGTGVPANEILFFPNMPARVDSVAIKAGEQPGGPIMTMTTSQVTIVGALSAEDAKLIPPGATVDIEDPERGVRATGTVTEVATAPGTKGADPQRFYLEVAPKDLPASLVGASVVLTIPVTSTEGEVLTVPVAALSAAADGTSRVEVRAPTGRTHIVTVRPGLAAKGLVAVTPVGGDLKAGDLVVVGSAARQPATSLPTAPSITGGNSAR